MEDARQSTKEILHAFVYTLFRRKYSIILISLCFFIFVMFFSYMMTPLFKGSATILVQIKGQQQVFLFRDLQSPPVVVPQTKTHPILNFIELLESRSFAEQIVKEYNLDEPKEITLLRDKIKEIIKYMIQKSFDFARKLGLLGPKAPPDSFRIAVEEFMEERRFIEAIEDTDLIEISVLNENPKTAAEIANRLAQLLVENRIDFVRGEAHEAYNFALEQSEAVEKKLRESENALKAFKEEYGIVSANEQEVIKLRNFNVLELDYTRTQIELKEAMARRSEIQRQLSQEEMTVTSSEVIANNPLIEDLTNSLYNLETRRSGLLKDYSNSHPDIIKIDLQIEEVRDKLGKEVKEVTQSRTVSANPIYQGLLRELGNIETNIKALSEKAEALQTEIGSYKQSLESLPELALELNRLESEVNLNSNLYETLMDKLDKLRIQKTTEIGEVNLKIVDPAVPPRELSSPNWLISIAIAIFLSPVFGLGFGLFTEYWSNSFRSIEDAENEMGLPVLGAIPREKSLRSLRYRLKRIITAIIRKDKQRHKVTTDYRLGAPVIKAYRQVVDMICSYLPPEAPAVLLISSSSPEVEAAVTGTNLALTMAYQKKYKRILLMDADLRDPSIHSLLGLEATPGLTEVIEGRTDLDDVSQRTDVDNLDFIPCGELTADPVGLLGTKEVKGLIGRIKSKFDLTLICSAPVEEYADSILLAPLVDETILVVNGEGTKKERSITAKNRLKEVTDRPIRMLIREFRNPIPGMLRKFF